MIKKPFKLKKKKILLMKIMSIFGTRPEIIRLSRIFELLDNNFEHVMVNTSQNFTHELNRVFFDEMKIRKPDYDMKVNTEEYGKICGMGKERSCTRNPKQRIEE